MKNTIAIMTIVIGATMGMATVVFASVAACNTLSPVDCKPVGTTEMTRSSNTSCGNELYNAIVISTDVRDVLDSGSPGYDKHTDGEWCTYVLQLTEQDCEGMTPQVNKTGLKTKEVAAGAKECP